MTHSYCLGGTATALVAHSYCLGGRPPPVETDLKHKLTATDQLGGGGLPSGDHRCIARSRAESYTA